jgi:transposase
MSKRNSYSKEFRARAVQFVRGHAGRPINTLAKDLGVPQTVLNNWVRRAGGRAELGAERGPSVVDAPSDQRVRELEKELARVKMERDFLKKAAAFFAKDEN